jgi:hypothetical protein
VLAAAGGNRAVGAIKDFTASGSITYSWANATVPGTATIKSRGKAQFRLDSQVPGGTWSMVVSNGAGILNLPDGTNMPIAYQNTHNVGNLTLPIVSIYTAFQDPTITVIDDGVVRFGSGQARQITIQQTLSSDSRGQFSKDSKRDYFFDPSSSQLLQVQDTVFPTNDVVHGGMQHILGFSNYRVFNGVSAPSSIVESISGQTTWNISITAITFNTGLTDADFRF